MSIHAGSFGVRDTQTQLRTLRDAGFEVGESREAKFLSAHGREIKAGAGAFLLLKSSKEGLLTRYLPDHDEGTISLSTEVADLSKASQLAEGWDRKKAGDLQRLLCTSFLLPRSYTWSAAGDVPVSEQSK